MKKLLILILFFLTILSANSQIKFATYWLAPSMTSNMPERLCRDSLLIIDYENLVNNHQAIEKIKKLNPRIKLIIYANPMEVWEKEMPSRPLANALRLQIPDSFRLKLSNKKPAIFWQGMQMLNMSSDCPRVKGKNYNEYYAKWLIENVLSDTLADGYFHDNGASTISWINPLIDADNNGKPDAPSALDYAWLSGKTQYLKLIREGTGKNFIIITNKGERNFFFITNGAMFEKFPNDYLGSKRAGGWYQCIENARRAGPYTIIQVTNGDLEFGIASSLLLDNTYVCLGQNVQIPDKFRIPTGKPLGKMYKSGAFYYRDYELVKVEVNPEKKTGRLIEKKDATR